MLWYLTDTLVLKENENSKDSIIKLKEEIENLTCLDPDSLLSLDILPYREKTKAFLQVNSINTNVTTHKNTIGGRINLMGAGLRDADIRGTDLRKSLFVTQSQINSAKGNLETKLPERIEYPKKYMI